MNIQIRPAFPEDWPALSHLWVESWTAFLPSIDFEARLPWFRDYVAELLEQGAVALVAASDTAPLGFVTINPVTQAMDQLVTARPAQRQGVGRQLVQTAKALSTAGVTLTVVKINEPAIRLYQSEGFIVTGTGVSERSGLETLTMRWPGREQ